MRLLKEFFHKDGINIHGKTISREAVRTIVMDGNRLLMIYSLKNNEYKFPGGGIEPGETDEDALGRETREETGRLITKIKGGFGQAVEYDLPMEYEYDVFKLVSRYYQCEIGPQTLPQQFDDYEVSLGFKPVWVDIINALSNNTGLIRSGVPLPRWTKRDTFVLSLLQDELRQNGKPILFGLRDG